MSFPSFPYTSRKIQEGSSSVLGFSPLSSAPPTSSSSSLHHLSHGSSSSSHLESTCPPTSSSSPSSSYPHYYSSSDLYSGYPNAAAGSASMFGGGGGGCSSGGGGSLGGAAKCLQPARPRSKVRSNAGKRCPLLARVPLTARAHACVAAGFFALTPFSLFLGIARVSCLGIARTAPPPLHPNFA
jgi:hypothetical protein